MPRYRKPGRNFTPSEFDRFLQRLAATGNMTAAAEAIGRPVKSLHARRRTDRDFDARCHVALARFRCSAEADRGPVPKGRRGALRTQGEEWVVTRGGSHGAAQLRRARAGRLTEAGLTLFLRTLAASANIGFAARSIGVTVQSIAYRRKRDLAFDQQVTEALKEGCARLETQLLESAIRGLGDRAEDEHDPLSAEVEAAAAEFAPRLPRMSAQDAFALLQKQRELLSRPQKWSAERDAEIMKLATARLEKVMCGMRLLSPGE